jgi:hypothetical protein
MSSSPSDAALDIGEQSGEEQRGRSGVSLPKRLRPE